MGVGEQPSGLHALGANSTRASPACCGFPLSSSPLCQSLWRTFSIDSAIPGSTGDSEEAGWVEGHLLAAARTAVSQRGSRTSRRFPTLGLSWVPGGARCEWRRGGFSPLAISTRPSVCPGCGVLGTLGSTGQWQGHAACSHPLAHLAP